MSSPLSVFKDAKSTQPYGRTTMENHIKSVRGDLYLGSVNNYRNEKLLGDDPVKADSLKKALPAITPSGRFSARRATGLIEYSAILVGDVDKVGEEKAEEIREKAKKDPYCLAAHISVSGDGVKLFYKFYEDSSKHALGFRAMGDHVKKRYNVTIDESGKDLARLCFVSHDPLAHYNKAAKPLEVDETGGVDELDALARLAAQQPTGDYTLATVREMLEFIEVTEEREVWLKVGMGLHFEFKGSLDAFELWDERSKQWPGYPQEGRAKLLVEWKSFGRTRDGDKTVTFATVIQLAQHGGWTPTKVHADVVAAWIDSPARTGAEEIREEGIKLIAEKALPRFTKDECLDKMRKRLKQQFGVDVSAKVLHAQLRKATDDHCKKSPFKLPREAENLVFVATENKFYDTRVGKSYVPDGIDHKFAKIMGDSDLLPHETLLNRHDLPVVDAKTYDPGATRIFEDEGGALCVNTYRHSYPAPDYENVGEAMALLDRHLKNLIAEPEYRRTVMDFMAYLVQYPGEKVLWAIVIQGAQGSGKSTLAAIMERVLGVSNVRRLEAGNTQQSRFNGWAGGTQLAVWDEVHVVGPNPRQFVETLKPAIADTHITVENKNVDAGGVKNVTNYMFFTNHHDAIPIDDNERRFFIIKSPLQTAQDLLAIDSERCCDDLYSFLKAHPGAFRAALLDWKISPDFKPKGHAPVTSYKGEMVRDSESPLKAEVRNVVEGVESFEIWSDLFAFRPLFDALRNKPGCERATVQTVSKVLQELGYKSLGKIRYNGEQTKLWAATDCKWSGVEIGNAPAEFRDRLSKAKGSSLLS
jgi:hypothetical protein